MKGELTSKIPLIQQRMHLAAAVMNHRAAERHVAEYQQTAPRDTGLMTDSTFKAPEQIQGTDPTVEVVSPQFYAPLIEFGTVKMEPRPRFLPAFASTVRQFHAEASAVIGTVLVGGQAPLQTVTISRSGSQRSAPAQGVRRKL